MQHSNEIPQIKIVHISELTVHSNLVNLGEVLEIEEQEYHYSLVISRLNEKQVLKFYKEIFLAIVEN